MAKKSKKISKWFWALWALVVVAGVSLFLMPINRPTPKVHWRAPVHMDMPNLPKEITDLPDKLANLPKVQMPDVDLQDVRDLGQKVVKAMPDLPSLPYEAAHPAAQEPPPVSLPPVSSPPSPPEPAQATPPIPQPLPTGKGHGRIAIIIDDVGLARRLSERAVRLPAFVTLAYLPYAHELTQQAEAAQARGHDIMLHLPMEPVGHENPGPDALLSTQSEDEWRVLTQKALNSFDGFIGVNNHMGSRLTTNQTAMRVVMNALKEKGAFFIDSRTSNHSLAETTAQQQGVATAGRDVFLDDTQTAAAVQASLAQVEQIARHKGYVVAIGHPHAVTLEALERWIPAAQARGFVFVPVRTVVKTQY